MADIILSNQLYLHYGTLVSAIAGMLALSGALVRLIIFRPTALDAWVVVGGYCVLAAAYLRVFMGLHIMDDSFTLLIGLSMFNAFIASGLVLAPFALFRMWRWLSGDPWTLRSPASLC